MYDITKQYFVREYIKEKSWKYIKNYNRFWEYNERTSSCIFKIYKLIFEWFDSKRYISKSEIK